MSQRTLIFYSIKTRDGEEAWCGPLTSDAEALQEADAWSAAHPDLAPCYAMCISTHTTTTRLERRVLPAKPATPASP